ncbi:GCN5 family acetyltransferase [Streptomyces cellostaticus]|uniref:GCN5 family acetyltransferase n=1 Tax=Streptomyces cellostaticus TaxID=67285 RepID=A0A101NL49_9ACTN|nr:GNAT family N-acetyltransferase [Streptomyces cellostaticus]KUM95323.1 GCN5 family acetyltransferase [Streptomyces cellostaticus]GHI01855.1 N-acetyltransferase [Streptomyces cellostaticus]
MTGLVIRTLDESSAHLFDALPDPLGLGERHRQTRFRPDWKRVALRDGRVVARAAWWARPEDPEPLLVNWFDVAEGEAEAGAELLRTAPWHPEELELDLPAGWRDVSGLPAAVGTRTAAARKAGYEPLVERFLYRWTPDHGLPERPGRLTFSTEPDDTVFFDALRRIHSVTLDAHARRAIEHGGVDQAAQEELDVFRWFPSPRAWWQLARTPGGEIAGIHIPARNPSGPCVGFIGVLPEHRGHGYAYDLLAECTHFLAERGAEFIAGATDQGNFPMAAHFTRAGYPVVRERVTFWADRVVSAG